jgi:hypothetical protein
MPKRLSRLLAQLGAAALLLGAAAPAAAAGEVTVFDRVSTVGTPVDLTVRTTRWWMADGGRSVEVFLDERPLGRILTGADGYGYLRVAPESGGLRRVRARTPSTEAAGLLLAMGEGERAVMIELETLLKAVYLKEPSAEGCGEALKWLAGRYRLIYVFRFMGAGLARNRLAHEGFPESAVLRWTGRPLLESLASRGVRVHAVVGAPEISAAARGHAPRRFSFEKAKDKESEQVLDWRELLEKMRAE